MCSLNKIPAFNKNKFYAKSRNLTPMGGEKMQISIGELANKNAKTCKDS